MIYHVRTIHALNRKISGSAHAHSVVQRFVRFMMFLVIWEANFCQFIPRFDKSMIIGSSMGFFVHFAQCNVIGKPSFALGAGPGEGWEGWEGWSSALLDARKSSSSWKEVRREVKRVKGPVLRRQKQHSFPAPPLPRIQAQECRKCQQTICPSISTVSNAIFNEAARVITCAARVAHANCRHVFTH